MNTSTDLDLEVIDQKLRILYLISAYRFVKQALQSVIFNKLFLDGYVCCAEGLYPVNKDALKKELKASNSPLYSIVDRNCGSFENLYKKISEISDDISKAKLSQFECQGIVYALLETERSLGRSFCVFMLLSHYFGRTRFHQHGEFVVSDDVNLVRIDSLQCFVAEIEKIPANTNALFRGHSNINYSIQPSLFRLPRYYKNEYMMYQELVLRCPDEFLSCSSHLDFLVEMQHYGLPTRLLDFSFNPLVALYFACENKMNTGEVIVYNVRNSEIVYGKDEKSVILSCLPMLTYTQQKALFMEDEKIDELTKYQELLVDEVKMERPSFAREITYADIRTPIFVKPQRNNRRISRQEGAFLLWGLNAAHYTEEIDDTFVGDQEKYRFFKDGKKNIYYVPQKHKKKIEDSLNKLGINKAFIYPEIDDVADYIKNTIED